MSAFPLSSNLAHVSRYGNARSMRQISEPAGEVVTKSTSQTGFRTRSSSLGPISVTHHSSADSHDGRGQPLARHLQHSLKLEQHMGGFTSLTNKQQFSSSYLRSISVNAIFGNILPPKIVGLACSRQKCLHVNIRNTHKQDFGLVATKDDSGFGSASNVSPLADLGLATTTFIKSGAYPVNSLQCVIDAFQNIATNQTRN